MNSLSYTVRSSTVVWSCPWWKVRKDEITFPNGENGEYNYVEKPKCVFAVPVTLEGEVVMIWNYRHPVKEWCWEIPAGIQKEGKTLEETTHEELKEEIGGTANALEFIGKFYFSNGLSNEEGHVFLATGVTLEAPHREASEIMETHCTSIDEALSMARSGEITDAISALALLVCEDKLRDLS